MSSQISHYYCNPFATPLYQSVSQFRNSNSDSRETQLLRGIILISDILVVNPFHLSCKNIATLRKIFFKHSFAEKLVSLAICTLGCLWLCCMLPSWIFITDLQAHSLLWIYHGLDRSQRLELYNTLDLCLRSTLCHELDKTLFVELYLSLDHGGRCDLYHSIERRQRAELYLLLEYTDRNHLLAHLSSREEEELNKEVGLLLGKEFWIKYESLDSISLRDTRKNPEDITCTITSETYNPSVKLEWVVVESGIENKFYDFFVYDDFVQWFIIYRTNPNTKQRIFLDNIKKLKP